MLKIRLQRFGKKKYPIYRIAVMHSSVKRDGKPVERLGFYNPHTKELVVNMERVEYWASKGAQFSETAKKILDKGASHNLADGPFEFKAKKREDKEQLKADIREKSTKLTKAKKKKKEAEEEAKNAPAEEKQEESTEEAAA